MIQADLHVAVLQADLVWNNVNANLSLFERQIQAIDRHVDLYVLPEMFSTGFCMQPEEVAATAGEESLQWLLHQAKRQNAGFCGSLLYLLPNGRFVNRMFLVESNGTYTHYDKRHRFAMAGEDKAYAPGNREPVVAHFRGWNILLQVCYDLRFPVFSRNVAGEYQAIIYVANWPVTRRHHWRTLLTARAIENQAYCIGVNRIGQDENGLGYVGDSMIVSPLGNLILDHKDRADVGYARLNFKDLMEVRKNLPFLKDADAFRLLD